MTFQDLGVIQPILDALDKQGYKHPTPIQEQSIPIVLRQQDLLGCAQTGTGKTAAFAIPILQLLSQEPRQKPHRVQCLILTPTRELAIQIGENFSDYGAKLHLKHAVIFGGVPQGSQVQAIRNGIDILIATPGRLLDLCSQGLLSLQHIKIFVLDEADRMLDMGFVHDVRRVVGKIPVKRQTLFFSATMPAEIQSLADSMLHHPEKVEVTPVSSTVEIIDQSIYHVDKNDKRKLLAYLLKNSGVKNAIVFTRTKHGADRVAKDLGKEGIHAEAIHGNKSQNARQRALNNFKTGDTRVLVATDIAARGIDIDAISHIVNFELPEVPETYVHRIGRTGRAGASGTAYSFCDAEEKDYLRGIEKLIKKQIPKVEDHPFPSQDSGMVQIRAPKGRETVGRPNSVNPNRQSGGNPQRQRPQGQSSQGQSSQGQSRSQQQGQRRSSQQQGRGSDTQNPQGHSRPRRQHSGGNSVGNGNSNSGGNQSGRGNKTSDDLSW